ncbi:hypothetical protein MPSEU_000635300 [Mayamaea pseudoterrestris]|nr:hypothetical protein MPSEU_000635300 [Mayamaea pseudoterrestris]
MPPLTVRNCMSNPFKAAVNVLRQSFSPSHSLELRVSKTFLSLVFVSATNGIEFLQPFGLLVARPIDADVIGFNDGVSEHRQFKFFNDRFAVQLTLQFLV